MNSAFVTGDQLPEVTRTGSRSGLGDSFLTLKSAWVLASLLLSALAIRIIFLFIAPNNSTDAWSRYIAAIAWLKHPGQLPHATASDAWLPMHFWLLGGLLWITKSEMAARGLSVILGSLTVLLLAGIGDRCFNRRVAVGSAVLLSFFGFHIAFSVTTSSEALTIFLIALGTYAWARYAQTGSWSWALASAAAFNVASLCRFEPWLCGPVLALALLLGESGGWPARRPTPRAWLRVLYFGVLSSAGAIGWLVFSYLRWGDPFELPHRTIWLNAHFQPSHHTIWFRLLTVPSSIVLSLGPLVAALGLIGAVHVWLRGMRGARAMLYLALVLFVFNYYNSVRYETTQARYTLLYNWLFLLFAFDGSEYLLSRWKWANASKMFAVIVIFFVLWQAGIVAAASYAPQPWGDHLGALSPTIPLHAEIRQATQWLKANGSQYGSTVLDDYNWESTDIFRFANLDAARTFRVKQQDYDDPTELKARLEQFVKAQHPGLLVCSPEGPIGKTWCAHTRREVHLAGYNLLLAPLWVGGHWQIYSISYGY